jgi:hypothetical protein
MKSSLYSPLIPEECTAPPPQVPLAVIVKKVVTARKGVKQASQVQIMERQKTYKNLLVAAKTLINHAHAGNNKSIFLISINRSGNANGWFGTSS